MDITQTAALPAAGWSQPDSRGHITYTQLGADFLSRPPTLEGYVAYFIARHGLRYTRWTYRPVK